MQLSSEMLASPRTKTVALAAYAAEAGRAHPTRLRWACGGRACAALVREGFSLRCSCTGGVCLQRQRRCCSHDRLPRS